MARVTATSYAMLGLLAVQPWSTHELAGQMDRSLGFVWPRARSVVFDEPKKLVANGLAKAEVERYGRRTRTIYSITAKGRRALRSWLAQPSAPPQFEAEALVRTIFAEHGTKSALLATLRGLQADATALLESGIAIGRTLVGDDAPFQQRLHVNALGGRFVMEYAAMLLRWAAWAENEVRDWPDVGTDVAPLGREVLADALAEFDKSEDR
jgi:DNA-binding PadR family transcriptional regulator